MNRDNNNTHIDDAKLFVDFFLYNIGKKERKKMISWKMDTKL